MGCVQVCVCVPNNTRASDIGNCSEGVWGGVYDHYAVDPYGNVKRCEKAMPGKQRNNLQTSSPMI